MFVYLKLFEKRYSKCFKGKFEIIIKKFYLSALSNKLLYKNLSFTVEKISKGKK